MIPLQIDDGYVPTLVSVVAPWLISSPLRVSQEGQGWAWGLPIPPAALLRVMAWQV